MKIKNDPFIYCQGCRKEHTIDKVECVEVLPYNDRVDQLVYWCDKMKDVYISMIYNSPKIA